MAEQAEAVDIRDLTQEHEPQIPVGRTLDVDFPDTDSALGSETSSSSVTDYRVENGRTYHAYHDGAYYLPNDEVEADRLDLQHHIWRLTLKGDLYISPLPRNAHAVLDAGTGTGIWAIEFAQQHPETHVTGIDLSPIQPTFVPPNCQFIIDNVEADWIYESKFDFVHARLLVLGLRDWPRFFRQAWDNMKPGAWIEMQEGQFILHCDDGSSPPDSPCGLWSQYMTEAAIKAGLDPTGDEKFPEQMTNQGFVNMRAEMLKWPIGPWPKGKREKEIGRYTLENFLQGIQGVSMALLTRHLGWSRDEVEVFLVGVRKQIVDPSSHVYFQVSVHSAQKPLKSSSPTPEEYHKPSSP